MAKLISSDGKRVKALRAVTLTAAMVTAALAMNGGSGTNDEERGGREEGIVGSVALILPDLSPGDYSALNPTVGIEAM
jgi:hypothetical protein